MENKKFGALTSSVNPEELSLTVASFVKIVGFILGTFATMKGVDLAVSNEQVQQLVEAFVIVITSGLSIWQGGNIIFGFFRKLMVWFYKK